MTDKPLSILITRFPYESVLSGEEWHTITLAEKLRERGHKVAFMGSCHVLAEELAKRDFPVVQLAGGPVPVSSKMLLRFMAQFPFLRARWSRELRRLTKELGLTTIYMHSLSEKLLLTPVARRLGLKVVWVEHQRWGRWMLGNPLRHLYKRLADHVDIIGVSPLYQAQFRLLGLNEYRTHIITNGIDLQVFRPEVDPLPLGNNALHIGTIARMSVDKGVDLLLEAFSDACRQATDLGDVHLHLVGEGPLKDSLEAQAKLLACHEKIHFYVPYRTIPRSDTPRFLKALDIFVLPSALPDPFGLVAAESMAVGTATLVTDACGIHYQLVSGQDSMIIQAADKEALQTALLELLRDTAKRQHLAAAARATAEREFSLETMVDAYLRLLTPQ